MNNDELERKLHSNNWKDRVEVARQGYGLDVLVNDKDADVRRAVAEQGYGLDVLVNDESSWVRHEVAEQGYGLDVLINDKDWWVRQKVAEQGYGLKQLILDGNEEVSLTAIRALKTLMKENKVEMKFKNSAPEKTKPIERD